MQGCVVDGSIPAIGRRGHTRRGRPPVSVLLRVMAALSLMWALLFVGCKDRLLDVEQLSPLVRALANGLGAAHVALACVFWHGARAPTVHRGAIYGALILLVSKTANDLYGLLVLLPPGLALLSLLDLVISVALLVAVLEALPRTFAAPRS
jgi:hypothetical protein